MLHVNIPDDQWLKAKASVGQGACVELAPLGDELAVRNSNRPHLGALPFTKEEMAAFVDGAKRGEFDHLT